MTGTTLITGADGYVGRMIASRLLAGGDEHLVLAVRAADPAELAAKRSALGEFCGAAAAGRVTVTPVDLRDGAGLDGLAAAQITAIVHCAAVTRFNVDQGTANSVNVAGTARVCEFARRCDRISRLLLISTIYSAGRQTGPLAEVPHPGSAGFVNSYEWSKWAAERLALTRYGELLPLSVLRLSTVVADDDSGVVSQFNAFHHALKLFFYGLMSVVPGDEGTPIHVTSGSYSAAAAVRLLEPTVPPGIYHACPGVPASFRDMMDIVFRVFESDQRFRRRNLVQPPFCDRESFRDLVQLVRMTRSGPVLAALETFVPFADQLYLRKDVSNERLNAVWPGHRVPEQRTLIASATRDLVATRWGRQKEKQ
jgi:nucleoside-diphosphate-sugar epimerase